jgi:signal transduction histidine kinase
MALDNFSSYTEALAAWLASDCQDESHLLQGKALEDAKKLIGCRSLSEQDYQFLITSQELEKRELLKKLEIARQATQDVNQKIANFLANTRTELATPINCIISSLKVIIDGVTDSLEEDQDFINHAYECALDTLNQVNDLLDIANEYKMVHSVKLDPTPQIPPNVDP